MGVQIKNNSELKKIFVPKLEQAVDYVVQKMWNENRDLIRKMVYDVYVPTTYERTGEFKNAWDTSTNSNTSTGKAQGRFEYDPDSMSVGWPSTEIGTPEYGRHASAIDNFDARPYLAEIIYEGLAGPAFGHGVQTGAWAKKRDVWQELNKIVGKRKLKEWFQEGCNRVGVQIVSHKASIGVLDL